MTIITLLVGTDGITTANSMAKINTNLTNLNTGKIETSVIDTDTSLAANSDAKIPSQKAVKAYVDSGGNANASTTTKGIVEEATAAELLARTAAGATGARLFVNPSTLGSVLKFGGDGSDGAYTRNSGTEIYDLAGVAVFIKQFTSLALTGTGAITFTNPHANGTIIIIKVQGAVTITTSATRAIDLRSLGGAGGAADIGANNAQTVGTDGYGNPTIYGGGARAVENDTSGKAGGNAGFITAGRYGKTIVLGVGGGGGGGASSNNNRAGGAGGGAGSAGNGSAGTNGSGTQAAGGDGGIGGRGAGALLIECGGALNITGTIDASGIAGGAAATSGSGGGGGGSGSIVILYSSLIANTGTYTVTASAGGAGTASFGTGGAGGAGYSLVSLNYDFS